MNHKILLVDDEKDIVNLIEEVLVQEGERPDITFRYTVNNKKKLSKAAGFLYNRTINSGVKNREEICRNR